MIADLVVKMDGKGRDEVVLPTLNPVYVTASADAEHLYQVARASIAMPALDLRAASIDADNAEAENAEVTPSTVGSDADVRALHDWLKGILDQHYVEAQREFAIRLQTARIEAAAVLSRAQAEATAIVESARAQMLETLLGGAGPGFVPPVGGGSREVPVLDLTEPMSNGNHQPVIEGPPFSSNGHHQPVIEGQPFSANSHHQPVIEGQPFSSSGHHQPMIEGQPFPSSASNARINGAAVASPQETSVETEPPPAGRTEIRQAIADPLMIVSETLVAQTAVAETAVAEMAPGRELNEASTAPPALRETRKRSPLANFVYLDVLLPLTAVVILIVMLLALVG